MTLGFYHIETSEVIGKELPQMWSPLESIYQLLCLSSFPLITRWPTMTLHRADAWTCARELLCLGLVKGTAIGLLPSFISFFLFLLDHSHQQRNLSVPRSFLFQFSFSFLCALFSKPAWNSTLYSFHSLWHSLRSGIWLHHTIQTALVKGPDWPPCLQAMVPFQSLCYSTVRMWNNPSCPPPWNLFFTVFWRSCSFDLLPSLYVSPSQSLVCFFSSSCPFNVRVPRACAWSPFLL